MFNNAKNWLETKMRKVIEITEHKMTLELLTSVDTRNQKASIVASLTKNIGTIYQPYIDCIDTHVTGPNKFEKFIGITLETKVEKAQKKLHRQILKRIKKGLTRENIIMEEDRKYREEFFANAI